MNDAVGENERLRNEIAQRDREIKAASMASLSLEKENEKLRCVCIHIPHIYVYVCMYVCRFVCMYVLK